MLSWPLCWSLFVVVIFTPCFILSLLCSPVYISMLFLRVHSWSRFQFTSNCWIFNPFCGSQRFSFAPFPTFITVLIELTCALLCVSVVCLHKLPVCASLPPLCFSCCRKQVQHTQDIFSSSGIIYRDTVNQIKQSHEGDYQACSHDRDSVCSFWAITNKDRFACNRAAYFTNDGKTIIQKHDEVKHMNTFCFLCFLSLLCM